MIAASLLLYLPMVGPAGAVELPGTGGRIRIGGTADGLAVVDTGGGPRQRPQLLLDVQVDADATRWLRGHAELRGRIGGPFEDGDAGVYNFGHAFQNRSPSLEVGEAYVDLRLNGAGLRAGVQKLAWGKLDGLAPSDVVNPRDYHDPLVQDLEEAKIGVPAVLGSCDLPEAPSIGLSQLHATVVYVPIAVPSRLPLPEERWFPPSLGGDSIVLEAGEVERVIQRVFPDAVLEQEGDFTIPLDLRTANRRAGGWGGVGARLGGTWRGIDWDIQHYSGPYTGPNVDLRAELFGSLSVGTPPPGSTTLPVDLDLAAARAVLRQAHDRTHLIGFDWATAFGGATVRSEAAFSFDRPYLRAASDLVRDSFAALTPEQITQIGRDLRNGAEIPLGDLSPALDSFEWGIGVDYLWNGFFPLLQVNQIVILDPAPRLLIADPETRLTGLLRRSFWRERLELEVRALHAIERRSWFVLPRLSYLVRDDLRVRLGYLAIGGNEDSLIGQFRRNDEVVLQLRYDF